MKQQYPNLEWYLSKSKQKNLPPRCPIAACDKCPRYYLSLRHLGDVNLDMSDEQRLKLESKWEFSDVFVNTENTVSSTTTGTGYFHFSNFCPELSGITNDVFASNLANYVDSFDKQQAHKELEKIGADKNHTRWKWMWCDPKHYSECLEFSVYKHEGVTGRAAKTKKRKDIPSGLRWRILERDGFKCFYCGIKGGSEAELQLDHKISVIDGGTNDPDNLVTSCAKCNGGKGKRSVR